MFIYGLRIIEKILHEGFLAMTLGKLCPLALELPVIREGHYGPRAIVSCIVLQIMNPMAVGPKVLL